MAVIQAIIARDITKTIVRTLHIVAPPFAMIFVIVRGGEHTTPDIQLLGIINLSG